MRHPCMRVCWRWYCCYDVVHHTHAHMHIGARLVGERSCGAHSAHARTHRERIVYKEFTHNARMCARKRTRTEHTTASSSATATRQPPHMGVSREPKSFDEDGTRMCECSHTHTHPMRRCWCTPHTHVPFEERARVPWFLAITGQDC